MAKYSNLEKHFQSLSIVGAKVPLVTILEALVKEAETVVLESSPSDPKLSENLIKSRERRLLLELFKELVK